MNTATVLTLPRRLVDGILKDMQKSPDVETCGLVGAAQDAGLHWYPVDNIATDPAHRFEMDPRQQIASMRQMRERNEELFAIVHSHPDSPALPSAADIAENAYPDVYYLIVSLINPGAPELRGFRQRNGIMEDVELRYE